MVIELPAGSLKYLSYELAEALGKLSEQQQRLIERAILRDAYTAEEPAIPAKYIGGKLKLVSTDTYYKRGEQDADGNWHGVGWHHQVEFREAVRLAKARVRQARVDEDLRNVATAKSKARAKLVGVVRAWDDILQSAAPARDRVAAGQAIVNFAMDGLAGVDAAPAAGSAEEEWWATTEE